MALDRSCLTRGGASPHAAGEPFFPRKPFVQVAPADDPSTPPATAHSGLTLLSPNLHITTTTSSPPPAHSLPSSFDSLRLSPKTAPLSSDPTAVPPRPLYTSTNQSPRTRSPWQIYPMAMLQQSNYSSSSSNYYSRRSSNESTRRANIQASAYAVDASTMALTSLHFSTCGAGAAGCGDAAYHITEECERLFCETLKTAFLVEKNAGLENSLVMDVLSQDSNNSRVGRQIPLHRPVMKHGLPTPSPSPDGRVYPESGTLIRSYFEMWDYVVGTRFRGFVAEVDDERSLFVFFDKEVIGKDLKPGLMALLELAGNETFDCSQLVVGVDRTVSSEEDVQDTSRDLRWVGFELMLLDAWAGKTHCVSDRWTFLAMDV
ncbi:Hypothetical protein R9X50_00310900 [Acrodontium crateriforme]|uniref:Ornithine decarboxylase antizyme n=1 Tax=Acrodontium crateriforme TaxID=150365 RepID=A0AAQ3R9M4_9PEZI|nr:Hypothetical protein R9X50_00310900 [Acrodontium crateriforme]